MGYYNYGERRQRLIIIILSILVMVLGIFALRNCSPQQKSSNNSGWWQFYSEEEEPEENEPEISKKEPIPSAPSLPECLFSVMNVPTTINIQEGESFEECFLRYYPELGKLTEKGLGGPKLLGEICADAHRQYKSKSRSSLTCSWPRPTDDLGIGIVDSDDDLPNRINEDDVKAEVSPIDDKGGGWFYTIFGLYVTIENLRGWEMDVTIRQGLLLETIGDDVQNIVVRESVSLHLKAYEKQTVRITAYCASHHRSSPVGYPARITPFYLMAESSVFQSQTTIWEWQEEWYANLQRRRSLGNNGTR